MAEKTTAVIDFIVRDTVNKIEAHAKKIKIAVELGEFSRTKEVVAALTEFCTQRFNRSLERAVDQLNEAANGKEDDINRLLSNIVSQLFKFKQDVFVISQMTDFDEDEVQVLLKRVKALALRADAIYELCLRNQEKINRVVPTLSIQ